MVGVSSTRQSEPPDTIASLGRISTNTSAESTISSHTGGRPGEGLVGVHRIWEVIYFVGLMLVGVGRRLFSNAHVHDDTFLGNIKRNPTWCVPRLPRWRRKQIAIKRRHSSCNERYFAM